jgi:hypothetical protein
MKEFDENSTSAIKLKSNIVLKSQYEAKNYQFYLPVEFLGKYKDVRSLNGMTAQQANEFIKIPFLADRVVNVYED